MNWISDLKSEVSKRRRVRPGDVSATTLPLLAPAAAAWFKTCISVESEIVPPVVLAMFCQNFEPADAPLIPPTVFAAVERTFWRPASISRFAYVVEGPALP